MSFLVGWRSHIWRIEFLCSDVIVLGLTCDLSADQFLCFSTRKTTYPILSRGMSFDMGELLLGLKYFTYSSSSIYGWLIFECFCISFPITGRILILHAGRHSLYETMDTWSRRKNTARAWHSSFIHISNNWFTIPVSNNMKLASSQ